MQPTDLFFLILPVLHQQISFLELHSTLRICSLKTDTYTANTKTIKNVSWDKLLILSYFSKISQSNVSLNTSDKTTSKSLCLLFFIKFLFFYQMITLQKLWEMFFISSKKLLSFSRYSVFCNFSPSFPHFPDSKG